MEPNRYEPPRASLDPRSREPGSIPKAVAIGAAIDIGGTMAGGILLGIVYMLVATAQGRSTAEIQQALTQIETFSALGLMSLAVGLGMSMLGGYQCAVIANRNTYLAPGIMSVVSVAFGALMNDGQLQLPKLLLLSGLTVASIMGAASLHIRKLAAPSERAS